uniref:Uncharacterized protein n=1 Tax=Arundo donax TaxID=35708 RepID=A0A0A9AMU2_ARUDO
MSLSHQLFAICA